MKGDPMKVRLCFGVLLLVMTFALAKSPSTTTAESRKHMTDVSVEDIGTKVRLVGRLGVPLGEMMTLTGIWAFPDDNVKDASIRFTVMDVNGKRLDNPVVFNVSQMGVLSKQGENVIPPRKEHRNLDGLTWTMRAYESGRVNQIPQQYFTEIGNGPHAVPYYYGPFTSELQGALQAN